MKTQWKLVHVHGASMTLSANVVHICTHKCCLPRQYLLALSFALVAWWAQLEANRWIWANSLRSAQMMVRTPYKASDWANKWARVYSYCRQCVRALFFTLSLCCCFFYLSTLFKNGNGMSFAIWIPFWHCINSHHDFIHSFNNSLKQSTQLHSCSKHFPSQQHLSNELMQTKRNVLEVN